MQLTASLNNANKQVGVVEQRSVHQFIESYTVTERDYSSSEFHRTHTHTLRGTSNQSTNCTMRACGCVCVSVIPRDCRDVTVVSRIDVYTTMQAAGLLTYLLTSVKSRNVRRTSSFSGIVRRNLWIIY